MPSYPIFVGPGGSEPGDHIRSLETATRATVGDGLYGGQIIRSRILQRTAQGVDANGAPFAAYSASYHKQKSKKLGKADPVDLFGPDAHVHMLNTLAVHAGTYQLTGPSSPDPFWEPQLANGFELGFYGQDEAMRARVHNEGASIRTRRGTGRVIKNTPSAQRKSEPHGTFFGNVGSGKDMATMPQRKFFDASQEDVALAERAIGERMMERVKAKTE